MKKTKFYTALKLSVFGLFVLSSIVSLVYAVKYLPEDIEQAGNYFFTMIGFICIFFSLEGGAKIFDREWFMFSPDEPYSWDEKIFYPVKFFLCAILWIVSNIMAYVTVISILTGGPLSLAYVLFGFTTTALIFAILSLLLLLIIIWYANMYKLRQKML